MAFALPCLPTRLLDGNGVPLALAQMFVYLAGTVTPTDFYTSATLTVVHPNPLTSDAGGLFPNCFLKPGDYKIKFTSADGAPVFQIDSLHVDAEGSQVDFPTVVKTANFSVQSADKAKVFLVDASAGNVTVSADSETLGSGFPFFVVNTGATGNVTVIGVGAQTVDGSANRVLNTQNASIGLVSKGASGWQTVMSSNSNTFVAPVTFSSSVTLSRITGGSFCQPCGRQTLLTATPVLTTDQTGKTSTFFTPYQGNRISLYNGTDWSVDTFTEVSQLLTDAAKSPAAGAVSSVYYMMAWADAGAFRVTRGPAWTTATNPGTGAGTAELELFSGVWVNKYDIVNGPLARRGVMVACIGTDAAAQLNMMFNPAAAAGGTNNRLDVWNNYNRVGTNALCRDSTDTWLYSTATWRAANGSNSNRINIIVGLSEDAFSMVAVAGIQNNSNAGVGRIGIGLDSTTAFTGIPGGSPGDGTGNRMVACMAVLNARVGIGAHFFQQLEYSDLGASTWAGDNGTPLNIQSGLQMIGRM